MQNLMSALRIFSIIMLFVSNVISQENKYTRKNKTAKIIQYTTDKCYSRSIVFKDSIVYSGNSNGSLYSTNLRNEVSMNLLKNKKFEEMRDIEFSDDSFWNAKWHLRIVSKS
jgi:hypothetical protein